MLLITNNINLTNLNKMKEIIKNIENANLINRNILSNTTANNSVEVKKLNA